MGYTKTQALVIMLWYAALVLEQCMYSILSTDYCHLCDCDYIDII